MPRNSGMFVSVDSAIAWYVSTIAPNATPDQVRDTLILAGANRKKALYDHAEKTRDPNAPRRERTKKDKPTASAVELTAENVLPVLARHGGSYSAAAKELGTERRALMEWHKAHRATAAKEAPATREKKARSVLDDVAMPGEPAKAPKTSKKRAAIDADAEDERIRKALAKAKLAKGGYDWKSAAAKLGCSADALKRTAQRLGMN